MTPQATSSSKPTASSSQKHSIASTERRTAKISHWADSAKPKPNVYPSKIIPKTRISSSPTPMKIPIPKAVATA